MRDHYLWPGIAAEIANAYAELTGRSDTLSVHPPTQASDKATPELANEQAA